MPAKTDVMAPRTADQLLAHNCHGLELGCWKAPNAAATDTCKVLHAPKK